jgi:membrane associated rhomboid family serine protease
MQEKTANFLESLIFPLIFVAIMWLTHIVQYLFEMDLFWLGVKPRSFEGVLGIGFSPLIHSGFTHLTSNSIPFLASGAIIMSVFKSVAFRAFGIIYLMTGVLVWLFADFEAINTNYHIGASGVVYGMVTFIFFSGLFVRNRLSIAMSLIMLVAFSGMISGISPFETDFVGQVENITWKMKEGVSWESHLLGAIVGMIVAFIYRAEVKKEHESNEWQEFEPTPDAEADFFLPRDTFDKTKHERLNEDV